MPGLGGWKQVLELPVYIRRMCAHQFVQQKEKEHQQMEAEKRKAKHKK